MTLTEVCFTYQTLSCLSKLGQAEGLNLKTKIQRSLSSTANELVLFFFFFLQRLEKSSVSTCMDGTNPEPQQWNIFTAHHSTCFYLYLIAFQPWQMKGLPAYLMCYCGDGTHQNAMSVQLLTLWCIRYNVAILFIYYVKRLAAIMCHTNKLDWLMIDWLIVKMNWEPLYYLDHVMWVWYMKSA